MNASYALDRYLGGRNEEYVSAPAAARALDLSAQQVLRRARQAGVIVPTSRLRRADERPRQGRQPAHAIPVSWVEDQPEFVQRSPGDHLATVTPLHDDTTPPPQDARRDLRRELEQALAQNADLHRRVASLEAALQRALDAQSALNEAVRAFVTDAEDR